MGKAAGSRPAKAANKSGAIAMPIRRLLENHVFGPDEIQVLTTAFEDTLRTLRLVDRATPRRRSSPGKSSNWHSRASAIRSDCVNARFNFCRNRAAL